MRGFQPMLTKISPGLYQNWLDRRRLEVFANPMIDELSEIQHSVLDIVVPVGTQGSIWHQLAPSRRHRGRRPHDPLAAKRHLAGSAGDAGQSPARRLQAHGDTRVPGLDDWSGGQARARRLGVAAL